jgi:hypothetical protein
MAATEFKSFHLRKLTVADLADPAVKPVNPTILRQFLNLLAKDMNRFGMTAAAISDNHQLTANSRIIQKLDPSGGSKDVRLPVLADIGSDAMSCFFIINSADAAENLVVKKFTGSAEGATVVTIGQDSAALVVLNGSDWALGCIFSIALA